MEVLDLSSPLGANTTIIITISLILAPFFLITLISVVNNLLGRSGNLPPGRLGWPIIGEMIDFGKSARGGYQDRFIFDRMSRYSPKVFKTSILGEKMAVICETAGNKFVFTNERKLVRAWLPGTVLKLISPGLESSPEEEFLIRRRLFNEFLRPDAVQKYIGRMDSTVKQHMDSEWVPGSTMTAFPVVKKLTFSLACRLFMGIYHPLQIDKLEEQFETVTSGFNTVPLDLPLTTFRRAVRASKFMRGELENIVREKRQQHHQCVSSSDEEKNDDLMSHLLVCPSSSEDEGKFLSEGEIANILMIVLIASHETTSSLLINLMYYLADNPHVYDLALKEQLEIKSSKGVEMLTWEDTKKMKYGRNVVNEVMRLAPPTGGFFREVIHDISFEGFTIPKGWKLFCSSDSTHKNPEYFPDPEKFDPTRFEGSGPLPYSFTPFGGGPRMCPGYEYAKQAVLVFMHNLLVNFKWEKLIANEKIIRAPTSYPANGMPIKLQRRDTTINDGEHALAIV